MIDFLAIIFFGWPAVLVVIILAVIGLIRKNYRFLFAAAILALPFSWLLSGYPLIGSPAFLLPLLLFASGYSLYRGREILAWLLVIPYFLAISLLSRVVLSQ